MIPFASVSCLIRMAGAEMPDMEVSLRDLSAVGFTFRLAEPESRFFPGCMAEMEIRFRPIGREEACVLLPEDLRWTVRRERGYCLFRAETDHPGFHRLSMDLMKRMNGYIRAWEETGEAGAAEAESGFAAGKAFPEDGAAFLAGRCRGKSAPEDWGDGMALWLPLEGPDSAARFLEEGAEGPWRARLARAGLEGHPLAGLPIRGIQAGSAWCPDLFPCRETLLRVRDRAERLGLSFGTVLPPVPESRLEDLLRRIRGLDGEITVNDYGTAALLAGERLVMGVLLNRRRKDPRMAKMALPSGMEQNGTNSPVLLSVLKRMGFVRLEWETCGCSFAPPEMPGTLRLPFYQISTSSRCPLRAALEYGDRGRPMPAGGCADRPCGDTVFLYPAGLPVIGKYTTLFGYDENALWDGETLRTLRGLGADRITADL